MMTSANRLAAALLGVLLGLSAPGFAEDTDLFVGSPNSASQRPNVLIILDNTANWSASAAGTTKYALEKTALQSVVSQTSTARYNIGLMLFGETGSGNPRAGYVRYAIREMTETNRTALAQLVACLKNEVSGKKQDAVTGCQYTTSDKGSNAKYALAMYEAYQYFNGLDAYAGHIQEKRDMAAFATDRRYRGPAGDACTNSQIIFISNGAPDENENGDAEDILRNVLHGNLGSDPIDLNPSGRQSSVADEFARFMAGSGKAISTYTIDVNPETTGQGPDNTALLKSMANQGHGRYYAVYNGAELELALQKALDEIIAVNSVYASTGLPVSVNVRGTYLNEVYMAEFRPNANKTPRWWGNLKLYQLAVNPSSDSLILADSSNPPNSAVSAATGFIRSDAVSYWTTPSTYWEPIPRGTPPSGSDSPDGEVVEKGGSAQMERTAWPTRNLYTCNGTCAANALLSSKPFNSTNVSATALGLTSTDSAGRDALIAWVKGADNTATAERTAGQVRPSLHGDVVHSRPLVVNYNRTGTDTDIVVFFGANDGVLRAVKGGKNQSGSGSELWGFIAPEHLSMLKRLRDNDPLINPIAVLGSADNKPYMVDGNISVYTKDKNKDGRLIASAGDQVVIFVPMRRGGRFLYAFDVSVPETPKFLWRRGNTTTTSTGYRELGQTWSEPKVSTVRLWNWYYFSATNVPVLIMGAGYDPLADDAVPPGTASVGRGILVIEALTGNVIWQVGPNPTGADDNRTVSGMTYSFPASPTVIDRDGNGRGDRVYAADTGGNVWRLDISDYDPYYWEVNKLAALGGTGTNARKFLYPPDVVYASDGRGDYDAVLIGSGNREQPFDTAIENYFFMLKDRYTGTSGSGQSTIVMSDLYNATEDLIQDGTAEQRAAAAASLLAAKGWYVKLAGGEKVVGSAVTVAGSVFFGTSQWTGDTQSADSAICTNNNLGVARIYSISFKDAQSTLNFDTLGGQTKADRSIVVAGGGFLPSPTPVILENVPVVGVSGINPGLYQTVCFGPNCVAPPSSGSNRVHRLFWYQCIEGDAENAAGACGN